MVLDVIVDPEELRLDSIAERPTLPLVPYPAARPEGDTVWLYPGVESHILIPDCYEDEDRPEGYTARYSAVSMLYEETGYMIAYLVTGATIVAFDSEERPRTDREGQIDDCTGSIADRVDTEARLGMIAADYEYTDAEACKTIYCYFRGTGYQL